MPAGFEVTVPVPVRALDTVRSLPKAKVAAAFLSPYMMTVQLPVPSQVPGQPVKIEVAAAVAVSVTDVP